MPRPSGAKCTIRLPNTNYCVWLQRNYRISITWKFWIMFDCKRNGSCHWFTHLAIHRASDMSIFRSASPFQPSSPSPWQGPWSLLGGPIHGTTTKAYFVRYCSTSSWLCPFQFRKVGPNSWNQMEPKLPSSHIDPSLLGVALPTLNSTTLRLCLCHQLSLEQLIAGWQIQQR